MVTGAAATGNHASATPDIAAAVLTAIAARYDESGAARFGVSPEGFRQIVAEVVGRYAAEAHEGEQIELITSLHVAELVLARACAGGNDAAWEVFLTRFRAMLYEAAYRICRNDSAGRELADELYSELYGLPNQSGRRVCRLDYYMGRGSMEGWLRAVLSQQHVNRIRSRSREVSLDEQLDAGVGFAAKEAATAFAIQEPSDALAAAVRCSLAELAADERFLLASWYLDRRTLADIARQLRVHESTISRRLDRITGALRKRIRKRLQAGGFSSRQCDERMGELDVRDLDIDVSATLRQESPLESFQK